MDPTQVPNSIMLVMIFSKLLTSLGRQELNQLVNWNAHSLLRREGDSRAISMDISCYKCTIVVLLLVNCTKQKF